MIDIGLESFNSFKRSSNMKLCGLDLATPEKTCTRNTIALGESERLTKCQELLFLLDSEFRSIFYSTERERNKKSPFCSNHMPEQHRNGIY